jgi:hypothetical protein
MTRTIAIIALVLSWGCRASESTPPVAKTVDAAQVLREMSDTLAGARQLTFTATRQLDPALVIGGTVKESAEIEVWVSRPQKVRARMTSNADVRSLYADGQQVSLIDEGMKVYATVPLPGTIDDVIDFLDARYGFTPPLAEFLFSDPYKRFSALIQSSTYKGRESVNGAECDRVTLTGEIADADVWIAVADHLPRRFVATFKDREGSPQLTVEFSSWNLAPTLDESVFVFAPPKEAYEIAMVTTEEADAAAAAGAADAKGDAK